MNKQAENMVLPYRMTKYKKYSRSAGGEKRPFKHLVIQNLLWAIHTDKLHVDSGCTGYYQLCSVLNYLLQHHDRPYEKNNKIWKK